MQGALGKREKRLLLSALSDHVGCSDCCEMVVSARIRLGLRPDSCAAPPTPIPVPKLRQVKAVPVSPCPPPLSPKSN